MIFSFRLFLLRRRSNLSGGGTPAAAAFGWKQSSFLTVEKPTRTR